MYKLRQQVSLYFIVFTFSILLFITHYIYIVYELSYNVNMLVTRFKKIEEAL